MRRWLVLMMCVSLFVAPQFAHADNESCTSGVGQCSREIAVTTTNSIVTLNMRARHTCVFNAAASTATIYVMWVNTAAQGLGDVSHPILADRHVCVNDQVTTHVHLITAAGTATANILAFP